MANRAVFLDRDGTMAKDVPYCSRPENFKLFPDTAKAIKLLSEYGFKVIVITNQSGIARGYFTEEALDKIHDKMQRMLAEEGTCVNGIYFCPHHPEDNCDCRKPKPKLILQAARDFDIDLKQSFVVGDLQTDIEMSKAVGCSTVLISRENNYRQIEPDCIANNLLQVAKWIVSITPVIRREAMSNDYQE